MTCAAIRQVMVLVLGKFSRWNGDLASVRRIQNDGASVVVDVGENVVGGGFAMRLQRRPNCHGGTCPSLRVVSGSEKLKHMFAKAVETEIVVRMAMLVLREIPEETERQSRSAEDRVAHCLVWSVGRRCCSGWVPTLLG